MIRIEFESLVLELISEADLEQIRNWRNEPHVRSNMDHQTVISTEDQQKWFESLDKKRNLYFKIISAKIPIGVLNIKDIDWEKKNAQAGIFIGEKEHLSTMMPIIAVFVLMKVCFDCFGIKELRAKIANHNTNALNFNTQFGYSPNNEIVGGFTHFVCSKDAFYSPGNSIKKLHDLFNKNGSICLRIDTDSSWIHSYMSTKDSHYTIVKS